jgi:HPt (histidine-containing phosphotransfer) domain-containing protein
MTDELPLLDHQVIADLRDSTGDDDEFVRELIETYVGEVDGLLGDMSAAIAAADIDAVVRPAHTLKSSSASVGAMRLSAICRAIEESGRTKQADGLGDRVRDAESTWTATLAELRAAGLAA